MNFRIDVSNFYRTGTLINKSFDIVFTNVLKQYGGFPEASLPNNKTHAQHMGHGYLRQYNMADRCSHRPFVLGFTQNGYGVVVIGLPYV
jgi:hypothetical protein